MTKESTAGSKAGSASIAPPSRVESLNARRPSSDGRGAEVRRQIAAEDLDLIVRRAAAIQNKRGSPGSELLTEEEVIEIGRQVGLEPDHVRRAMAEVHAESLAPRRPPGNRILDLIGGDSRVEVRRVVAGGPTLLQQQVEMLLRDREKLSALRRRPTRSVWEASAGIMDRLDRFMNFSGKEYALAETRQVELAVAETEPGWTLVTFAADLANKRDEILYTGGSLVAVAAILAGVFIAVQVASASSVLAWGTGLLAGLLVGVAAGGVAVPLMRSAVDKQRNRIELILEGLIDEVDR